MADETLSTDISGPNGLPDALQADLDLDNTFLPVDDKNGKTVNVSVRQLLTAFGNLLFTDDVTGTGIHGSIALTIANGVVTLAKLADLPAKSLIGNGTGALGAAQALTLSPTDFVVVGSEIQAVASAGAADAATAHDHRFFHGF